LFSCSAKWQASVSVRPNTRVLD